MFSKLQCTCGGTVLVSMEETLIENGVATEADGGKVQKSRLTDPKG